MNYTFYALGTRGTHPVFGKKYEIFGGQTSCYLIKKDDYGLIIDCGTGLYDAKELLKDCKHVDVLLTHVHYDHIIGLVDFNVFPKDCDVVFHGNFIRWFNKISLDDVCKEPYWPVAINFGRCEEYKKNLHLNNDLVVDVVDSSHAPYAAVFVLNINDKRIGFFSDFEYKMEDDLSSLNNLDMLFYDGTFDACDYDGHGGWGHSTWKYGVELVKKYNIKQLNMVHHNPDYDDNRLLEMEKECQKYFSNSKFIRSGDIFEW